MLSALIPYLVARKAVDETEGALQDVSSYRTDDLRGITDYIEAQRALVAEHPTLAPIIKDYEEWLSGLSWYARTIDDKRTLSTAKWYRNKVNAVLRLELPPDWVPADAARAAESPPLSPALLPNVPTPVLYAAGLSFAGLVGLAVVGLLGYTGRRVLRKLP